MGGAKPNLPGNADPYSVQLSVPTEYEVIVGSQPKLIVPPNAGRNNLLITNLSQDTIYLWKDASVSASKGFVLVPNGGFFKLARWEDFDFTCYEWYAIAANAGGDVFAFEQSKLS